MSLLIFIQGTRLPRNHRLVGLKNPVTERSLGKMSLSTNTSLRRLVLSLWRDNTDSHVLYIPFSSCSSKNIINGCYECKATRVGSQVISPVSSVKYSRDMPPFSAIDHGVYISMVGDIQSGSSDCPMTPWVNPLVETELLQTLVERFVN